jgi:hypothetical protein
MCTSVTPAVPYLLLGLQDVQWAVGNSRGARKLTRTPHVNKNKKTKKKEYTIEKLIIYFLKYFKIIFFYFKKIIFNINIKKNSLFEQHPNTISNLPRIQDCSKKKHNTLIF